MENKLTLFFYYLLFCDGCVYGLHDFLKPGCVSCSRGVHEERHLLVILRRQCLERLGRARTQGGARMPDARGTDTTIVDAWITDVRISNVGVIDGIILG